MRRRLTPEEFKARYSILANNLTGRRFGRLTALWPAGRTRDGKLIWECQCRCDTRVRALSRNLRDGTTRSCGCLKRQHGHTTHTASTPTYMAWANMKQRCLNPRHRDRKNYGGRGITVCERWLEFKNFLTDMGERPPGLSLDRIDNDGNYEPSNCRWATSKEQIHNRRRGMPCGACGKKFTHAHCSVCHENVDSESDSAFERHMRTHRPEPLRTRARAA